MDGALITVIVKIQHVTIIIIIIISCTYYNVYRNT